jgi:HME family heavy-metal exporter
MQIATPDDTRRPTDQPIGCEVRQFHVQPNRARMSDLGVSLDPLESALREFWPNT